MTHASSQAFYSLTQFNQPCDVYSIWPTPPAKGKLEPTLIERSSDIDTFNDRIVCGVHNPECMVYTPQTSNGIGVIIFPGGGYQRIAMDNEGCEVAAKLNTMGYTVFVATYRMPGEGHSLGPHTSLADAQRTIRWVRHHAKQWQLNKVGVMGFSAGGHLAGMLTTHYSLPIKEAMDDIDALDARPDFAALMYPVITMLKDQTHRGSFTELLGTMPSDERLRTFSVESNVHSAMPPCFLLHACDDLAVNVDNSVLMWQALKQLNVPVEMHLFEKGRHGFGIRKVENLPAKQWPELFHQWLSQHLS